MGLDYYDILGLEATATGATIRAQYRQLALAYHPQKPHDDPQKMRVLFAQLGESYDVLNDRFLRELYDQLGTFFARLVCPNPAVNHRPICCRLRRTDDKVQLDPQPPVRISLSRGSVEDF